MLGFSTSSERFDLIVLILFLVFFVDPWLPNRIAKVVQSIFVSKEKE